MHKKYIHDLYVYKNDYKNEMVNTVFIKKFVIYLITRLMDGWERFPPLFLREIILISKNSKLQGKSESNIFGLFVTLK